MDTPRAFDWPKEKVLKYVLEKQPATERHLYLYVKSAFENFRGQRFAPSTALLYCRFDDPVPSAQLGLVAFNGHPRKAYFAAKESMQTVLPILFFGMTGPEDVRVINDYWHKSWNGCTLKYTLKNRDGSTIKHVERKFDPARGRYGQGADAPEAGEVWLMPGFFAELQVVAADGVVLSENHYDMTNEEIVAFVTNVYPVAPEKPLAAVVVNAADAVRESRGLIAWWKPRMRTAKNCSNWELAGRRAPRSIQSTSPRPASIISARLAIQGKCSRDLTWRSTAIECAGESAPYLDLTRGITRRPYSTHNLWWIPGWQVALAADTHKLLFMRPESGGAAARILDAIAVQPTLDMSLAK